MFALPILLSKLFPAGSCSWIQVLLLLFRCSYFAQRDKLIFQRRRQLGSLASIQRRRLRLSATFASHYRFTTAIRSLVRRRPCEYCTYARRSRLNWPPTTPSVQMHHPACFLTSFTSPHSFYIASRCFSDSLLLCPRRFRSCRTKQANLRKKLRQLTIQVGLTAMTTQAPSMVRHVTARTGKNIVRHKRYVRQLSVSAHSRAPVAPTQASNETIEAHLVSLVQNADYPNYLCVAIYAAPASVSVELSSS